MYETRARAGSRPAISHVFGFGPKHRLFKLVVQALVVQALVVQALVVQALVVQVE